MIRITYISAVDGKASTRTYKTHDKAVEDWKLLTAGANAGLVLAATMFSDGRVMRAHSSGTFVRACERTTWAN